jgi:hypothetical protein
LGFFKAFLNEGLGGKLYSPLGFGRHGESNGDVCKRRIEEGILQAGDLSSLVADTTKN